MNNNIYNINWRRLTIWFLPIALRQVKHIAWLQVVFQPIKQLWLDFTKFRKQATYKVIHTSQVCYLEAVLNDLFDNTLRRIYIENGLFIEPLYIYTVPEDKPRYIDTQYIFSENDLNNNDTDFIVIVPLDLKPLNEVAQNAYLSQMKALINYYKLASKTYTIQWI